MDKKILLLLVPLLFLAGCVQTQQKSKVETFGKCNLPSKPGKIELELLGFPDEIIVEGKKVQYSFDLYIKNYITSKINGFKLIAIPNIGNAKIGNTNILNTIPPSATFYYGVGLTPGEDFKTVNVEIPAEVSNIGIYTLVLKAEYNTSTEIDIPVCIGYDPKITKVSVNAMACNPTELPKPCYSSSPVIPASIEVKPFGSKAYAKYRIKITLSDPYGILKERNGIKEIKIDEIKLIVDQKIFSAPSEVVQCYPSPGKSIRYPIIDSIICTINLAELKKNCNGVKCYVDETALEVGKGALLKVKLSYAIEDSKKYGPARIITYQQQT